MESCTRDDRICEYRGNGTALRNNECIIKNVFGVLLANKLVVLECVLTTLLTTQWSQCHCCELRGHNCDVTIALRPSFAVCVFACNTLTKWLPGLFCSSFVTHYSFCQLLRTHCISVCISPRVSLCVSLSPLCACSTANLPIILIGYPRVLTNTELVVPVPPTVRFRLHKPIR